MKTALSYQQSSNYQENILSEQHMAKLNIGDPLQDDKQNPLAGAVR